MTTDPNTPKEAPKVFQNPFTKAKAQVQKEQEAQPRDAGSAFRANTSATRPRVIKRKP
jgi:hypothetical protein